MDFAKLGEALDTHGYRDEVTLETEYKNYASPAEVDAENRFALEFLRSVGWQTPARVRPQATSTSDSDERYPPRNNPARRDRSLRGTG